MNTILLIERIIKPIGIIVWCVLSIMFFTLPEHFEVSQFIIVPIYLVVTIAIPFFIAFILVPIEASKIHAIISAYLIGCMLTLIFVMYYC